MTMRYFAALYCPARATLNAEPLGWRARERGFAIVCERPGLFLAVQPSLPVTVLSSGGCDDDCQTSFILGRIFCQDVSASIRPDDIAARLMNSPVSAEMLMDEYWGDYVAILSDGARHKVTLARAPFGALGCLHAFHEETLLFGSDPEALSLAGLPQPSLEIAMIARRIGFRELPASQTCLAGVSNLLGGTALDIEFDTGPDARLKSARSTQTHRQVWSPWAHAGRRLWRDNEEEARDTVRAAILQATRACTAGARRTLLTLSGGLDSSVLAASLATVGSPYACLNLRRSTGEADERRYARAVAGHLGCELIEEEWSTADVDVTCTHAGHLADPIGRSFMQGTNSVLARGVEACAADLTMDGGGGDNVFCALQSVAPVVDAFSASDEPGAAWRTAKSIATIAETGIIEVVRKAIARGLRRSKAYRLGPQTLYLAPDIVRSLPRQALHPWFSVPPGSEAGTAAHIALIALAQGWAEERDLLSPVWHASPLATQPVVEACLQVPSWWWFQDGRNRVVARRAFANRLPPLVLARRSKGGPDDYLAAIYAANRNTVRTMIMDGRLRALGLIDSAMVASATRANAPLLQPDIARLLQFAEVEAWMNAHR